MRYGTGVSTGESGTSRRRAILRVPGAVITHPERGRLLAAPRFSLRAAAIAAVATAGLLAAAVRIRAHVTDSPWSPAAIAAAGSIAIAVFLTLKWLLRPSLVVDRSTGALFAGSRLFRLREPLAGVTEIRIRELKADFAEALLVVEDGARGIPLLAGRPGADLEAAARQIAGFIGVACRGAGDPERQGIPEGDAQGGGGSPHDLR